MNSPRDPLPDEIGSGIRFDNIDSYMDFLFEIIVRAPDKFRNYDYPPPYQLDFEAAFRIAREGMTLVEERVKNPATLARLRGLIEDSYQAFSSFDFEGRKKGSLTMQQFEKELRQALTNASTKGPPG